MVAGVACTAIDPPPGECRTRSRAGRPSGSVRLAAVADTHYRADSRGALREVFARAAAEADVLLLCGDLTDHGLPEEARALGADLREHARIPTVAVLGNHDFESDRADEVRAALVEFGVEVLDGEGTVIAGVGFAGVRGFGGGFGRWALNGFGEPLIKEFVRESERERDKLDRALRALPCGPRVALLHYAPLPGTAEGEALEIYPFLGSSHLEGPLDRHRVACAFHGHAHAGAPRALTASGVPVFNVALPVLRREAGGRPPLRVHELAPTGPAGCGARSPPARGS